MEAQQYKQGDLVWLVRLEGTLHKAIDAYWHQFIGRRGWVDETPEENDLFVKVRFNSEDVFPAKPEEIERVIV